MSTVFSMVQKVIADSREKLAAANTPVADAGLPEKTKVAQQTGPSDAEKVASQLDYLAQNLHLINDDRTPHEKLAEYEAVRNALQKQAMGDEPQGPHQTQQAPGKYQSPMNPGMTGAQMGAGGNQMASSETNTPGEGVLEAGQTGQANSDSVSPMSVTPNEHAYPTDGGNSTPTDVNDPPGGSDTAPVKIAQLRARHLAQMVSSGEITEKTAAAIIRSDRMKLAGAKFTLEAAERYGVTKKASGVPPRFAKSLMKKFAADAENPANISAGTIPYLQTAKGASPAQMQGTPVGEGTPDTRGSDQGREAIQNVKAAINATKGELKGARTRREMSKYLDNPAFSAAHDRVLQQSLENASSAGVKIAATKSALEKWASESPERRAQLQEAISKVKRANAAMGMGAPAPGDGMGGAPAAPAPPPPPMPGSAKMATQPEGAAPVSDAALAAAAAGVDPEEVARAEVLLAQQGVGSMGGPEMGAPGQAMPPGPEAQGQPSPEPAPAGA